jgi:hypothetical protein
MNFLKRQFPVIVACVAGLVMCFRYFVPTEASANLEVDFADWLRILVAFASILGLLSVLHFHSQRIKLKKPGFGFSYVTLAAFAVMTLAGFLPVAFPGFGATHQDEGSLQKWLFDNTMVPMQATMFSILAFFIASAAFRAFRARSFEATILLIAACVMMIGRVPLGYLVSQLGPAFPINGNEYHIFDFSSVASWLLNVPNAATQRGILLGVILSQVAIGVRIVFGIEKTYMGGGD